MPGRSGHAAHAGRPGPYLRVLEEGRVAAGDAVTVEYRPGHGVTVGTMFRALTTEQALLPRLLLVDGLVAEARRRAERYLAATGLQDAAPTLSGSTSPLP